MSEKKEKKSKKAASKRHSTSAKEHAKREKDVREKSNDKNLVKELNALSILYGTFFKK